MAGKLYQILEDQYTEAKTRAGQEVSRKLKNGLRIVIKYDAPHIILTLTRDTVYPSMDEWDTVVRHFPYTLEKRMPAAQQQGYRFTISARFPTQQFTQLKF